MILWLIHWLSGWLDMICGLISVITFTLWRPWWDFQFRAWSSKKYLKYRIKKR